MSAITSFVSMILALSVAAERMVEILKGWLPNLWLFKTNPDPTREAQRCACIHVLSGCCGALVAGLSHVNVLAIGDKAAAAPSWISYAVAGLLASAGSAFWNHALDIIKASKIKQEQGAISAVDTNSQRHLVVTAHPASIALAMTNIPAEDPQRAAG
jgi:hypothetical protein